MNNDFNKKLEALSANIKASKTFEEKLKKWAEFTVEYCHPIAVDKKKCFYAFQSQLKHESPKVLILGLNPGEDFTYESMYNHENDGWGLNQHKKMTPEVFLQQNPWYSGGKQAVKDPKKEWNILRNLNRTISVHPDLEKRFNDMVYMNILYFNSKDFQQFKTEFKEDWKEVYDNCIKLSRLLIFEIIKPRRIICLSITNCFQPFVEHQKPEFIFEGSLCKLETMGINVYGITHPSARKSNDLRDSIGWHLYADWFNKPIHKSLNERIATIIPILNEVAEQNELLLECDESKLKQQYGCFKFRHNGESKISIWFEFLKSHCGDLWFEIHDGKRYVKKAIKCKKPYNNWMTLNDDFDKDKFKAYFNKQIEALIPRLKEMGEKE